VVTGDIRTLVRHYSERLDALEAVGCFDNRLLADVFERATTMMMMMFDRNSRAASAGNDNNNSNSNNNGEHHENDDSTAYYFCMFGTA
jgi:hypothetical protein